MVVVAKTRRGDYHEKTGRDNEDSYLINKDLGFIVIADGISSSGRGKEASEKAVNHMEYFVKEYLSSSFDKSIILEESFKAVHTNIYFWDVYRRIKNMAKNILKNIEHEFFKFPLKLGDRTFNSKQEFLEFIGELGDIESGIKGGKIEDKEDKSKEKKYIISDDEIPTLDIHLARLEQRMVDHNIIFKNEVTPIAGCPATALLETEKNIYVSHIGDTKLYVKEKGKELKQVARQPLYKAVLWDFLGTREDFKPQKLVLNKKNIEYLLMTTDGFELEEGEIERKFSDYKKELSKEPEKTLEEILDVLIRKSKKHDDDMTLIALYNQDNSLISKIYENAVSFAERVKKSADNILDSLYTLPTKIYTKIAKPIANSAVSGYEKSKKIIRGVKACPKKALAIGGTIFGAVALASLIWYASTRPKYLEVPRVAKVVKIEEQKPYIKEEKEMSEEKVTEEKIKEKEDKAKEERIEYCEALPERIVKYETKATIMEPKVKLSKNRLYAVVPVKGEADALEMKIGDKSFVSKDKYGNNFIFDARIDNKFYEDIKSEQNYLIAASDIHGETRTQTASARGKLNIMLAEDEKISEELAIKDFITPKPAYNSIINSLKPVEPITKTEIIQERENYSIIGRADIKVDKETKTLDVKVPVYKDNINNACISISINAGDYKGWWTACSVPGEYTNNISVSAKIPDPIFNYVGANNNIVYQVTANEVKEGKRIQRASYNYYVPTTLY